MENAAEKMIIALDDLDLDSALKLVELTKPYARTFKVGLSLFSAYGPNVVSKIKSLGVDVFLDLKFHDIPMQVHKAIDSVIHLEPRFITCHALGGKKMLYEAAQAVSGTNTKILAVSILTSLNQGDYLSFGFSGSIEAGVVRLLDLAMGEGVTGFVASPHEVKSLRKQLGPKCFLVCPGVRSHNNRSDDQSRTMSAKDAILTGADALVIGRPITKAPSILDAAKSFNQEIAAALGKLHANGHSAQGLSV